MASTKILTIDDKKIKATNLDKVLYPETGFTKGQVIDYYRRISKYILPHLHDRPVTMKRFPEGVHGQHFYQKKCPPYKPQWVKTSGNLKIAQNFCLINDLPSLIWLENLASIEIHTLLAKVEDLNRPTMLIFDLDPGEPASLLDCLEIALIMRDVLEGIGLKCFPKTSGGNGLHFYLPLNTDFNYDQTKYFARTVAQIMEKHYPQKVVSKMSKQLRHGKVFIDWNQNVSHKTTVCVYSLRAKSKPTVSMPATWKEVEDALKHKEPDRLIYLADDAVKKIEKKGDIFREVLTLKQQLPLNIQQAKKLQTSAAEDESLLKKYRKKRDFAKTSEPVGKKTKSAASAIFVIHKHAATRLHYDIRLEAQGVLKSWAVPKGPSSDPSDKRLAVRTEDHPFDYKDFEGIIPEGQYGAGEVIIWDKGTYKNISMLQGLIIPAAQAVDKGKLEVIFEGEKIKGAYAFVRMRRTREQKENWLLIKLKDKYVDSLPKNLEQVGKSVVSGKTIDDLKTKPIKHKRKKKSFSFA